MASVDTRQKNMDRRRGLILEAARSIIIERGVDALSVRRLAEKSGLVVKTLYNLFGNKENILVALLEQATAQLDETIASASGSTGNFAQALDVLEKAVLKNAQVLKPAMLASFHLTGARDSDAMAMHQRRAQAVSATLQTAIETGMIQPGTHTDVVGWLLYRNYVEAVTDWAFGTLSDTQFKLHARLNVLTAVHAFVTPEITPLVDEAIGQVVGQMKMK